MRSPLLPRQPNKIQPKWVMDWALLLLQCLDQPSSGSYAMISALVWGVSLLSSSGLIQSPWPVLEKGSESYLSQVSRVAFIVSLWQSITWSIARPMLSENSWQLWQCLCLCLIKSKSMYNKVYVPTPKTMSPVHICLIFVVFLFIYCFLGGFFFYRLDEVNIKTYGS